MTREQLETMPISRLRGLDIKEPQDEKLVQEVLNEKLAREPQIDPNRPFLRSHETDNLTPEKERALEQKLNSDWEWNGAKADDSADEPDELLDDEEEPDGMEIEEVTDKAKGVFCQFCDAKGPIKHKKNCTK